MTLNDLLFLCMFAVCAWRRSLLAVLFCSLYFIHMIIESQLSDPAYYSELILIDAAIAMLVSAYNPSKVDSIAAICAGMFLIANSYGLVIWYAGLEPDSYNYACSSIYVITIALMLGFGVSCNERKRRNNVRLVGFRSVMPRCQSLGLHHKEDIGK